jgi:hypothetical protein
MNIYQRPLFRQAGGPIAPEMGQMMAPQGMGQQMMAPPPMMAEQGPDPRTVEALGQVEQNASMQAEQYGMQMMSGLDSAETPEQVINAMRGNQRPLESRYGELAEIVGQEDAQKTPETVLALLQPVMMMTEQGAMDSGIGELMGQLAGNVDMIDETGAPTQMGQGVGSLMMAGVGQQPPANFSQGGAVQRFQDGGEASRLQQLYSEMLPIYEGVMGNGEDQKRLTQAQILFDISDRAGAFAAGIDPRTGQRVQGSSAAQLSAALSGLGGQINQRVGAQDQQAQALRVAALQGASGEFSAERADKRAADRAAAAAGANRGIGDAYEAVDAAGNVIATNFLSDRVDMDAFRAANPGATIRVARTAKEPNIREFNGNLVDVTDPNNPVTILEGVVDRDIREVGKNLLDITDPLAPVIVYRGEVDQDIRTIGSNLVDVTDPASPKVVYQGEKDRDIRSINGNLIDVTDPTTPGMVYQSDPDRDIREFGGNLIDVTDLANPVVVMQGQADKDIRVVDGRVIDFSDTASPAVLYEAPPKAAFGATTLYDPTTGAPTTFNTATPEGMAAANAALNQGFTAEKPEGNPSGSLINIQMPDQSVRTVREDSPDADSLLAQGGVRVSSTGAQVQDLLTDANTMAAYAANTLPANELLSVQAAIADASKATWNPQNQAYERPTVTPIMRQAEASRAEQGLSTVVSPDTDNAPLVDVSEGLQRLEDFGGSAVGTTAFALNFLNKAAALIDANAPFPDVLEGIKIVNTLNETSTLAFRDLTLGRPAQDAVNQFATLSPKTATITGSPSEAAAEVRALIDLWTREIAKSEDALNSNILSQDNAVKVRAAITSSMSMLGSYRSLLTGLESGPRKSGARPNPADFRRD